MKTTPTRLHLPPGFTTTIVAEDRMALAPFGKAGTGKTRLCCTAPDPIGYIPLNRKCRKTVEKWARELGKTIVIPEHDFMRVENPMKVALMQQAEAIKHYRKHVDEIKRAAYTLYEHKDIRTLVIDDGTTFTESVKFAIWGRPQDIDNREKGPLNQEIKQFFDNLAGKNLIVPHQAKDLWSGAAPTGELWYEGWPHLPYSMNVLVELGFDESKTVATQHKKAMPGRYYLKVAQCQDNPELQGKEKWLLDDAVNFQMLANLIYPESDPEMWE